MAPLERDVRLRDGRVLRVLEDGDPYGRPVFVLHGTPGSRHLYRRHVLDAIRHGIRLIGHDRPGYGGSTSKPGRRHADEAADVAAIADDMGFDRFAVWGHSGGGAPALACAALLQDRVAAAACLAGTAPFPADGLDWTAGMGEYNVADWNLMRSDPRAWEAKLQAELPVLRAGTVDQIKEMWSSLTSDIDREAWTDEFGKFLHGQIQEGLKPGGDGLKEDNFALARPWGFKPSSIQVPLQLWHGKHDKFVPFAHGEWLVKHIPLAEAHLEEDEGHITLFERGVPPVQEWLASHL